MIQTSQPVFKLDLGVRKISKRAPHKYGISVPEYIAKSFFKDDIHYVHVILLIDDEVMSVEKMKKAKNAKGGSA